METKVLIIVDMLNDFIDPKGALYCGEAARAIVPEIRHRLDACRQDGHEAIFLQDAHWPDDKEFEKFSPHCIAGTWGSAIIEELAPQPTEIVIAKRRHNGFFGTQLDKVLSELKPKQVMVVGVCTSICVMDTVGALVNRDYAVQVPRLAVADFDQRAHGFALERMQKIYGARII